MDGKKIEKNELTGYAMRRPSGLVYFSFILVYPVYLFHFRFALFLSNFSLKIMSVYIFHVGNEIRLDVLFKAFKSQKGNIEE